MTFHRPQEMAKATRLTRSGRLAEATALLQRLLRGAIPARPAPRAEQTIDVDPRTGEVLPPEPRPASPRTRDAAGDQGNFVVRRFTGPTGSRDYMLFMPPLRDAAPVPLVVMLHGCKQSPEDFATGTGMNKLAAERGCMIAYAYHRGLGCHVSRPVRGGQRRDGQPDQSARCDPAARAVRLRADLDKPDLFADGLRLQRENRPRRQARDPIPPRRQWDSAERDYRQHHAALRIRVVRSSSRKAVTASRSISNSSFSGFTALARLRSRSPPKAGRSSCAPRASIER